VHNQFCENAAKLLGDNTPAFSNASYAPDLNGSVAARNTRGTRRTETVIQRKIAVKELTKATGKNQKGEVNTKAARRGSVFLSVLDRFEKDELYRMYFVQRGWDKKDAAEMDKICSKPSEALHTSWGGGWSYEQRKEYEKTTKKR
jgi:hypothetical protein